MRIVYVGCKLRPYSAHALAGGTQTLASLAFDDQHVLAARLSEMKRDAGSDDSSADDDDIRRLCHEALILSILRGNAYSLATGGSGGTRADRGSAPQFRPPRSALKSGLALWFPRAWLNPTLCANIFSIFCGGTMLMRTLMRWLRISLPAPVA